MSVLDGAAASSVQRRTTWYVSRHGDGTTGRSWASAWREPGDIDWPAVDPGDRIVLDGGPTACRSNYPIESPSTPRAGLQCGMVYRSALNVHGSGTAASPIVISLSTARRRDGTAVFFGGRATPLPYCNQQSYSASGSARAAGISVGNESHVVVDGTHRSGIMVYGARDGVEMRSDRAGAITLRNLELFDNGTYRDGQYGYSSDGEGISLLGHDIVIDRTLIHDNGQDAIQDADVGYGDIGHRPLHDITLSNSWLYERREHPLYPGFGFNAGAQEIDKQDCTHVDGIQIFAGGLHQQRFTISHDVFGPFLAQGVYPGDDDVASFDHVVVSNCLFLNVLDHAIIGPPESSDRSTPGDWRIRNVTVYMTAQPNRGINSNAKMDLTGQGHTLTDSIFENGYFAETPSFASGRHNIWWGGDRVVGGIHERPRFTGPLPDTRSPGYGKLAHLDLTARCPDCRGAGASLHKAGDLLRRIDRLDRQAA